MNVTSTRPLGLRALRALACALCLALGCTTLASGTAAAAPAQPTIEGVQIAEVTSTSAIVTAEIDPQGAATEYSFQYGLTTAYGSGAPAPAANVGSAAEVIDVSAHLQGLQPHTTYHFRLVAHNSLGAAESEDQTFTTQAAGGELTLPDGRVWEMVSPADKEGAKIDFLGWDESIAQASSDGNAITYLTSSPTEADPQGNANINVQVLATRGPDGWSSRDIATPHNVATGVSVGEGQEYVYFSPDLAQAVVQPFGNTLMSPEASEQTPYLRTNLLDGNLEAPCESLCMKPLVTGAPGYANVPPGTVIAPHEGEFCLERHFKCGPVVVGATPDLSDIVLEAAPALTATAVKYGLYAWSDGSLQLLSVLPDGQPVGGDVRLGGSAVGAARNSISDQGIRYVWSEGSGRERHLYLRDTSMQQTVQLSAVQGGSGVFANPAEGPQFQAASSDGSEVFFTDPQHLTADAGGGTGSAAGQGDLYRCDIVEVAGQLQCQLTDLTPTSSGYGAGLQGVLGAGEDGEYVYFVADAALAPGVVQGNCQGGHEAGQTCNLYVEHDGRSTFIASLSDINSSDWASPEKAPVRVSPNGEWLAFMSQEDLTGYSTRDAIKGKPDEEVYLYDAGSGHLVCASCTPTGAQPVGDEYEEESEFKLTDGGHGVWPTNQLLAANLPAWAEVGELGSLASDYQAPYLSDDGRLFFDSLDALVPQDVDGTWDVYEYEPSGVGDCTTADATYSQRSSGCVSLISAGTSAEESAFLGASENGSDVFFLTSARLVPQALGNSLSIYDARECNPRTSCPTTVVTPLPCSTGEACKPAPTPQPAYFGAPSSETFSGAGNVAASTTATSSTPRSLTRAQKLAEALKACRKESRKRRASCESRARKKYAAKQRSARRSALAPRNAKTRRSS